MAIYPSKKLFSPKKSRGKENYQVVDNIHDSATSGTDTTSQMLSLYSDVQKRTRFILCDKYIYTLYAILSVWHYKK